MRARDNPFATARLEELPFEFPDGMSWEVLLQRIVSLDYRGAIVGPKGSGKTTLLNELQAELVERGFIPIRARLDKQHQHFSPEFWQEFSSQITSRNAVLLDGAEQLDARTWKRFLREASPASGVIITSHRSGLLPTLVECRTSAALFRRLVGHLVEPPTLDGLPLDQIYAKYQGNVRSALLELYDHFAALPA